MTEKTKLADLESMPHIPTASKAQDEADEMLEKATGEPAELPNPKHEEVYLFDFEWTDGRGKVWKGKFNNHILSIQEKQLVGLIRGQFGGGVPFEVLDPFTNEINLIVAHMQVSLEKKDRPEWAADLQAMKNYKLLQELYKEVASHEATFFGY